MYCLSKKLKQISYWPYAFRLPGDHSPNLFCSVDNCLSFVLLSIPFSWPLVAQQSCLWTSWSSDEPLVVQQAEPRASSCSHQFLPMTRCSHQFLPMTSCSRQFLPWPAAHTSSFEMRQSLQALKFLWFSFRKRTPCWAIASHSEGTSDVHFVSGQSSYLLRCHSDVDLPSVVHCTVAIDVGLELQL